MLEKFTALRNLFEINAARQAEMDVLFLSMKPHPSKADLTLLRDIADHSVPEALTLLNEIEKTLTTDDRLPKGLLGKMLLFRATLPEQINNDESMKTYLETEYAFLSGPQRP
jgi:hypothetical protein